MLVVSYSRVFFGGTLNLYPSLAASIKYLMGLSRFSRGHVTAKKLPRDLCICSVNCSRVCLAVSKFFVSVSTVF